MKLRRSESILVLAFLLAEAAADAQDFTNFLYEIFGSAITITEYIGPGGPVTIPDTIDGLPVTAIGDWAFSESDVTSVAMGSGISSIGRWAFNGCTSLTNATSRLDSGFDKHVSPQPRDLRRS
jgi:hypothetical protein